MNFEQEIRDHIAACFAGLWIESHEHSEVVKQLADICRANDWQLSTWDVCNGLSNPTIQTASNELSDPLETITSFAASNSSETPSLLVLKNFHKFLGNPEIIQSLAEQIQQGKHARNYFVILSPKTDIPIELEKLFVVIEHNLPNKQQLELIAREIASEDELPAETEKPKLLAAASGLTRYEAENAFSLSIVRDGSISPVTVQRHKSQSLKKSGLLSLYESEFGFEQLGGMHSVKQFCKSVLGSSSDLAKPKGILLLGVPGTGKSAFAKALGKETGRPTVVMDIGRLMGGLVGESESNVRKALEIVDAMAPAVLFIDELEKALSGSAGAGRNDSGVASRMFGSILTWLSDHESDVFVVATSNDISQLPPELTRAERFDGIFFCDLPNPEERASIWDIWVNHFGMDQNEEKPVDENWTGSEIRSCCRLASLMGVSLKTAANQVIPIAVTNKESVNSLREWANNRCLSARHQGVFSLKATHAKRKPLHSVGPKQSNN